MSKRLAQGAAIRAIRERSGLSVSAFALKLGCTQGYMSNIELGHKTPTVEFLSRVARELGVPLDAVSYVTHSCDHEEMAA